jgi:hypothetical protein
MTAREGRFATLSEGCASRPSLSSYTTSGDRTICVQASTFWLLYGWGRS